MLHWLADRIGGARIPDVGALVVSVTSAGGRG
jgi:hypothetical protein